MKHVVRAPGLLLLACMSAAAQDIPRVETFLGYSFVRFNAAGRVPAFTSNGGDGQLIYNFSPLLGIVGDFGGYHNGVVSGVRVDNTVVNFQFGPRVSFRKRKIVSPYMQSLFGGAFATASKALSSQNPLASALPRVSGSGSAFAMLLGGGLNLRLGRHVSFRPVEVNYFLTRLRNPVLADVRNQNNLRYSAGLSFLFGGEKPAPPPTPPAATKACPDGSTVPVAAVCPKLEMRLVLTTARTEICPNETTLLTPTLGAENRTALNYQWTVNGQPVSQGAQFEFGASGLQPGAYRIGVTASGGNYNPASAEILITVREYRAPTGTVEANPPEVRAGEKATLTASFHGQCGGTIQPPVFTAAEGKVLGSEFDSSGVEFEPAVRSEQRKAITITATATDERGTGTATTTVTVVRKATIAAIRLPDILFPANNARVNNCGKRVLLEQLRSYFEGDAGGQAVLVGHVAENETVPKLALERAINAAAVITAGAGICLALPPEQVLVTAPGAAQNGVDFQPNFCASSAGASSNAVAERSGQAVSANDRMAESRRVVVWFVPTGGQLPPSPTSYQAAGALSVGSLGCPK
jgi:hypothetical protein